MTYSEALNYLFEKHAAFFKVGKSAFNAKLDTIKSICAELGNPQNSYPVIHVAGTNGKGSTASAISSILQEHGLKIGLYTSPHLYDFRERIRINGEMIPENDVVRLTEKFRFISEKIPSSFFELTTGMAFEFFKEKSVDIAVLETGLGGRLDATNITENKLAAVITPISKDHMSILGNTIEEVASEKAGIIVKSKICLSSNADESIQSILKRKATEQGSKWINLPERRSTYLTDLEGEFQQKNIHLAYHTVKNISPLINIHFDEIKALKALQNIRKSSGLTGRFEKMSENPTIYFDVAHNEDGVRTLVNSLANFTGKIHFVFSASEDKDIEKMLEITKVKRGEYYLFPMPIERSVKKEKLYEVSHKLNLDASVCENPEQAFLKALHKVKNNELILVFGSFFMFEYINPLIKSKILD